jgi:hypothetical protein
MLTAANSKQMKTIKTEKKRRHTIHVSGQEEEIYCEDEGDPNYKPPCYLFSGCKCGAMDVVVTLEGMRCAHCNAPVGWPNCNEGGPPDDTDGTWRQRRDGIECCSCGANYLKARFEAH